MAGKHISEANAATVAAMRELGLGYIMVAELPATIAQGVILLHNGILWRGLLTGESSLPAGTPWPVKGYKEFIFNIRAEYGEVSFYEVIADEWGISTTPDTTITSNTILIPYPLAIYGYANINYGLFIVFDDSNVLQRVEVSYSQVDDAIIMQINYDISGAEMSNLTPTLRFYPPAFIE